MWVWNDQGQLFCRSVDNLIVADQLEVAFSGFEGCASVGADAGEGLPAPALIEVAFGKGLRLRGRCPLESGP